MSRLALFAAVVVLPIVAACSSSTSQDSAFGGTPLGGGSSAGNPGGSSGSLGVGANANAAACSATGTPVFDNAVCVCSDYALSGLLQTSAPNGGAASVGVNGHSSTAAGTKIGGSFVAYGGLNGAGPVDIRDDLLSTSDVNGAGVLTIGRDLGVGGHLAFAGLLSVGGKLRAPDAVLAAGSSIGGVGPYTAPTLPCGCGATQIIDVPAAVADAALHNDNVKNGFSQSGLDLIGPTSLTLSAGDYYIKEVSRIGVGKLIIDGKVRLYIGGSLAQGGVNDIELHPGATLDLFVEGSVATAGAVKYGDASQPDAFRLYVGGPGSMLVTAGAQVYYGLIYAPRSHVAFAGVTEIHGALFAESLDWSGVMNVFYTGGGGASQGGCAPASPSAVR